MSSYAKSQDPVQIHRVDSATAELRSLRRMTAFSGSPGAGFLGILDEITVLKG
jgi:hypothetical protein